jgi:hypothetical protein
MCEISLDKIFIDVSDHNVLDFTSHRWRTGSRPWRGKASPKAYRDTTIIIDPNKNLENHLVQLIFASGAFGLCQKPSNTTRSEPAYWIYHSQKKLIEKFENFKTNNHPILLSLQLLDPLLKNTKNALSDFHSFVDFTFKLESDELFTYFYVFVFADNFGIDFNNYKKEIDYYNLMFLIGICSMINKKEVKFAFAMVRLIKETKEENAEKCFIEFFVRGLEVIKDMNAISNLTYIFGGYNMFRNSFPEEYQCKNSMVATFKSITDFARIIDKYPDHLIIQTKDKIGANLDPKDVEGELKNRGDCPNSKKFSFVQKNVNTIHSNYQKVDSCNNSEVDIPAISEEKESLNH